MRALKHLGCNTQQGQFKHNSKRIRRTQLHTYAHTHTSGLISISFSTMTHLDAFSEVDVYRSMNCCLYEPSSSSTLAFRMGDALAAATGRGTSNGNTDRRTETLTTPTSHTPGERAPSITNARLKPPGWPSGTAACTLMSAAVSSNEFVPFSSRCWENWKPLHTARAISPVWSGPWKTTWNWLRDNDTSIVVTGLFSALKV